MPVIFVVLFGYVFGSSITVPGGNYRSYLMSGLSLQHPVVTTLAMIAVLLAVLIPLCVRRYARMALSGAGRRLRVPAAMLAPRCGRGVWVLGPSTP